MKRILTLVWLTSILVCCDFGPRESSAKVNNPTISIKSSPGNYDVNVTFYEFKGMEYRVFHQYYGGMHVVNHTKELLEIELIQKQIDEIDKRNQE